VSSDVAKSRKRQTRNVHPFKSSDEFEKAIAPYMAFDEPRHLHFDLWGEDFRTRLLRTGVSWMSTYDCRVKRREFKGTFAEFLHAAWASIAEIDPDATDEDLRDVDREMMWLYRLSLSAKPRRTR
jgi:hypothetical protein